MSSRKEKSGPIILATLETEAGGLQDHGLSEQVQEQPGGTK